MFPFSAPFGCTDSYASLGLCAGIAGCVAFVNAANLAMIAVVAAALVITAAQTVARVARGVVANPRAGVEAALDVGLDCLIRWRAIVVWARLVVGAFAITRNANKFCCAGHGDLKVVVMTRLAVLARGLSRWAGDDNSPPAAELDDTTIYPNADSAGGLIYARGPGVAADVCDDPLFVANRQAVLPFNPLLQAPSALREAFIRRCAVALMYRVCDPPTFDDLEKILAMCGLELAGAVTTFPVLVVRTGETPDEAWRTHSVAFVRFRGRAVADARGDFVPWARGAVCDLDDVLRFALIP